ncbi:hypothetical protein IM40_09600 (plasmid) [Candidatus Paracaedimonas acanthamoebae]|nr:hypothetical protein IM40_09600 [Candidatus Paracaedimonas acanthamoebae]
MALAINYKIQIENKELTSYFHERFLSLTIKDWGGKQSDEAILIFDDRPYPTPDTSLSVPGCGASLDVFLGHRNELIGMGQYIIDDRVLIGQPDGQFLKIYAKGLNVVSSFLSLKTRSWVSQEGGPPMTLGTIISQIAQEHSMIPKVSEKLSQISIIQENQTRESDSNFLMRLAKKYGALFKPRGKNLVFASFTESMSIEGKKFPTSLLGPANVYNWRVTFAERNKFTQVQAFWYDYQENKLKMIKVGTEGKVFQLRHQYSCENETLYAAESYLKKLSMQTEHLECRIPGNPELLAEHQVSLAGFKEIVNGRWTLSSVTHKVNSKDYVTTFQAYR